METSQQDIARLIISAEARIETAISQLVLAINGVADASSAQQGAIKELKAARDAIRLLREQVVSLAARP